MRPPLQGLREWMARRKKLGIVTEVRLCPY